MHHFPLICLTYFFASRLLTKIYSKTNNVKATQNYNSRTMKPSIVYSLMLLWLACSPTDTSSRSSSNVSLLSLETRIKKVEERYAKLDTDVVSFGERIQELEAKLKTNLYLEDALGRQFPIIGIHGNTATIELSDQYKSRGVYQLGNSEAEFEDEWPALTVPFFFPTTNCTGAKSISPSYG